MHYGGVLLKLLLSKSSRLTKWRSKHRPHDFSFLLVLAVAFASLLSPLSSSFAATIVLSDVDNTLNETRQSRDGTFITVTKVFRIEQRSNTLQNEPEGERIVELTPQDLHRVKDLLGKGPGDFGAVGTKVTLQSGETFVPGNYMLVLPDSFERYTSTGKANPLLEDLVAALKRDPKGKWRGEFFDKMMAMLSYPELVNSFGVLSARWHLTRHWKAFFNKLKSLGIVDSTPSNTELFHGVSAPEYDRFGMKGDISPRKAGVLEHTAMLLGRVPLTQKDERLHPDGKTREKFHYLVFADDDQRSIELAAALFQKLAQSKQVRVKYALFNMGTDAEVKASGRPRYAIVEAEGSFRKATVAETIGEPYGVTDEEAQKVLNHVNSRCEELLMSGAMK